MFELDPVLQKNTFHITDLELCTVLLSNNAHYPWVILVPKRADISEIFELSSAEQQQLMAEICRTSQYIKNEFDADKLNVAALGNQVNQLHIHIIGRYKDDQAWPNPVWEKGVLKYEPKILEMMKTRLKDLK